MASPDPDHVLNSDRSTGEEPQIHLESQTFFKQIFPPINRLLMPPDDVSGDQRVSYDEPEPESPSRESRHRYKGPRGFVAHRTGNDPSHSETIKLDGPNQPPGSSPNHSRDVMDGLVDLGYEERARQAYDPETAPTLEGSSSQPQSIQVPFNPSMTQIFKQTVASIFQNARNVNISGNPKFINIGTMVSNSEAQALDMAKEFVSFSALHDSSAQDPERRCHPGTRQQILKQITNWVDDANALERIFWLNGPAGVGKSAIAQTVARSCGRNKIAATFFFFGSDSSRNDGNRLFTTLAWQLAFTVPEVRNYIVHALNQRPDLPRTDVETQFEHLILQPFQAISGRASLKPVIIIDGVDECSDEKLQRRFLKAIGDAVNDTFPLRFLIVSRPEACIRDTFDQFSCPLLTVDLAHVEDAHRDIEKYMSAEFSSIAAKQELDPWWPGQSIVRDFVSKSSGQFVYASTLIRFIGDEYESATSQLDIILGLKPMEEKSPYAELDALYLAILNRQPHQTFLMDFFAILVARTVIRLSKDLHKDDAILLGIPEKELHRKLRGMHSILNFKPNLDVYHRSFFDFLQESSRSYQYHISTQMALKRYLNFIVRCLSHKLFASHTEHFDPVFTNTVILCPLEINLSMQDLEIALQPLLNVRDELLKSPNLSTSGICTDCSFFSALDSLLLHLALARGTSCRSADIMPMLDKDEAKEHALSSFRSKERDSDGSIGLETCLSELLVSLQLMKSQSPASPAVSTDLLRSLLKFDPAQVASKLTSYSSAQNLFDFIFYVTKNGYFPSRETFNMNAVHWQVVLEILKRVPLFPQDIFLNTEVTADSKYLSGEAIKTFSVSSLRVVDTSLLSFSRFLHHHNITPLFGMSEGKERDLLLTWKITGGCSIMDWRENFNPSVAELATRVLDVAKAIQYAHSCGFALSSHIMGNDLIMVDPSGKTIILAFARPLTLSRSSCQSNVHYFGRFFYKLYFGIIMSWKCPPCCPAAPPNEPEIQDYMWSLIKRCWKKDLESVPNMTEVVEEIESWKEII